MVKQQSSAPAQELLQAGQKTGCPGDCMKCTNEQRLYCASQIGYRTMNIITGIQEQIVRLQTAQELLQDMMKQVLDNAVAKTEQSQVQHLFAAPGATEAHAAPSEPTHEVEEQQAKQKQETKKEPVTEKAVAKKPAAKKKK